MSLSILIVSYQSRAPLFDLLDDLEPLSAERELDLHVWDNASTDGTPEALRAREASGHHAPLRLHVSPVNLGFARAVNAALPKLEGRRLWLLNPDLRLAAPQRTLRVLEDALAAPGLACVGPALRDAQGRGSPGAGGFELGLRSSASHFLGLGRLGARALYLQPNSPARDVDWISGTAPLLCLQTLRSVGGFPEERFLYAEDIALGRRLRAAGHRLRYEPAASVVHLGQGSQALPSTRWVEATLDDYAERRPALAARALGGLFALGLASRGLARIALGQRERARLRRAEAKAAWRWRPGS